MFFSGKYNINSEFSSAEETHFPEKIGKLFFPGRGRNGSAPFPGSREAMPGKRNQQLQKKESSR